MRLASALRAVRPAAAHGGEQRLGGRTRVAPSPAEAEAHLRILERMLVIRRFEESLVEMSHAKHFKSHYHLYIGQEATAAWDSLAGQPVMGSSVVRISPVAEASGSIRFTWPNPRA